MAIIDDERTHTTLGSCEHCGKRDVPVRQVEVFGWMRESRGYYSLCFDCFAPRITWRPRPDSPRTIVSPVKALSEVENAKLHAVLTEEE